MMSLLKIALFVLGFFAAARFCKVQTDSFAITRISSSLTYNPSWDVPPPSVDLKKILNQPYFYLSKGAQAFVFASEDDQYVIKFFRHHHMSAPFWIKNLPFKWAQRTTLKKASKLDKDFSSYKLAYDRFKEQTGLLLLHLNKTSDQYPTLDLVDKLGIHHPIPLDQYEFLIQKKASLVYPALEIMIKKKEIAPAKETLSALVHLLGERMQQGIFDKDPDLNTNFGLIGTQPIQIDFGRYKTRAPCLDKQEISRITDHLHQWLMVQSPELDEHLRKTINSLPLFSSSTFDPSDISANRPYDPLFTTQSLRPSEQQEVQSALNQPYTYYGCGGQSFVFFSADGNYVLKFFKQSRYHPSKERLQREYGSYKTAFETLPQETGLIYIHFNPTDHLPTLTLQGHTISLDTTDFVLQRRAILLYDALDRSPPSEAKNLLSTVIHLITTCYAKNCHDKDPKLSDNCGIINGRAVKIDAGRLQFSPTPQRSLKITLDLHILPLRAWLAERHPELVEHLDLEVAQALTNQ